MQILVGDLVGPRHAVECRNAIQMFYCWDGETRDLGSSALVPYRSTKNTPCISPITAVLSDLLPATLASNRSSADNAVPAAAAALDDVASCSGQSAARTCRFSKAAPSGTSEGTPDCRFGGFANERTCGPGNAALASPGENTPRL